MKLTPAEKAIILKPVHCTKYLTPAHGKFHLEHNEEDNNWYFEYKRDVYAGKASDNISSHLHNQKFELKEKDFEGVVTKISKVVLSTTLGVYENSDYADVESTAYACKYSPTKSDGCSITAATVFFRNGCKRIVPLDCIKEYVGFTDGKESSRIMKNLETFIEGQSTNTITYRENGDIEIENSYFSFDYEHAELLPLKRYLILNVRNRQSKVISEKGNEWFTITDEEYQQIMDVMNRQMKEECGFIPDLAYGQTNFDRLENFANYPFAPEINAFSELLHSDSEPRPKYADEHKNEEERKKYAVIDDIANELKHSPDCVKKFIELFGIPYSSKLNKIFLQGHRHFAQYMGIWFAGIHDETCIEKLIEEDVNGFFAAAVLQNASFEPRTEEEEESEDDDRCFARVGTWSIIQNALFYDTRFLVKLYDAKTVIRLIKPWSRSPNPFKYTSPDALGYMYNLYNENHLPDNIIKKVGKEGFTEYNHNLLMRLYQDTHPSPEEYFENREIIYTKEEKELEWENGDYKFCLPENTNRLVDIGSKMNICVGHLYRDKAADKECTIVYAIKDNQYELCIEVSKQKDNRFQLIQRSAFNNSKPAGANLTAFRQWCREKNIMLSRAQS